MPHPPPPTPQQHQLEYWAGICKRCSRARGCEGLGRVGRRGEGRERESARKREGEGWEEEIIWVLHHQRTLLLLLLPIVEPWGPGEAALCLAVMQPLYHPNLLIVGAQLAHGGFLLEPPNIKQIENVAKMLLLLVLAISERRPCILCISILLSKASVRNNKIEKKTNKQKMQ